MAGTWHRPCLNCRYITLDEPDDEDSDDDDNGPWCELHDAPHLMGGLACELRTAENLIG